MRPIVARIDSAALAHNLMVARQAAGSTRLLAVGKANGYGHGLARVGQALRPAQRSGDSSPRRRNHHSSGTVTSGGTAASRASSSAHDGQRWRTPTYTLATT